MSCLTLSRQHDDTQELFTTCTPPQAGTIVSAGPGSLPVLHDRASESSSWPQAWVRASPMTTTCAWPCLFCVSAASTTRLIPMPLPPVPVLSGLVTPSSGNGGGDDKETEAPMARSIKSKSSTWQVTSGQSAQRSKMPRTCIRGAPAAYSAETDNKDTDTNLSFLQARFGVGFVHQIVAVDVDAY